MLRPVSPHGLNPDEVTIAETLKARGYATACIGKWHLGDQLEFLPTRQGFDEYYGVPYSDDMTEAVGKRIAKRAGYDIRLRRPRITPTVRRAPPNRSTSGCSPGRPR